MSQLDSEKQPLPEGDISFGNPVVVVPTQQTTPKWTWCHLVTAVFGNFCCQPFGTISLMMGMLAYTDHKTQDFERARKKRKMALGFGIAAIVVGSLLTVLFVGWMYCYSKRYGGGQHGPKFGPHKWGPHMDRDDMEF